MDSLRKQKKTLREQWLMDGLNTLSEEEQESAKAQTEDNQQQTKLLQSNIEQYVSLPVCVMKGWWLDYSYLASTMSFDEGYTDTSRGIT